VLACALQVESFDEVIQRVRRDLKLSKYPDAVFDVVYVDRDNDVITISSELEFREALNSVNGSDTPIKLFARVRK
jgi:hypothetical protein